MTSKESKKVVNKTQIIYISCTKAMHWNSLHKFISLNLPQMPLVVFVAQILRSSPLLCNMCRISLDSAFLNWVPLQVPILYDDILTSLTYGICASTVPYLSIAPVHCIFRCFLSMTEENSFVRRILLWRQQTLELPWVTPKMKT